MSQGGFELASISGLGRQQEWHCDDLSGLPGVEPDPKWDRRDALNVICRLDLGAAYLGPPTKRAVIS